VDIPGDLTSNALGVSNGMSRRGLTVLAADERLAEVGCASNVSSKRVNSTIVELVESNVNKMAPKGA
jgi:hypothetical protein